MRASDLSRSFAVAALGRCRAGLTPASVAAAANLGTPYLKGLFGSEDSFLKLDGHRILKIGATLRGGPGACTPASEESVEDIAKSAEPVEAVEAVG